MRKCALTALPKVFSKIAEAAKLYMPIEGAYKPWEEGAKWDDEGLAKSPKALFFPQTEDLMTFKISGKQIAIEEAAREAERFVVFGVRACDVKSLEILDSVFLAEPVDTFYAARREHGTVIALACSRPTETCFCGTFGISPEEPAGDISAWKTQTEIFFSANTPKGEALLRELEGVTEECADGSAEGAKRDIAAIIKRLPLAELKADAFGGGNTDKFFNAPEWDMLSEACLGCGACTYVCPTCQCYDIKDCVTAEGAVRLRCWDSCMYSEFTRMAHGNNRVTQKERFRQRFMHKLVYYPENNGGTFGCVGCGRCIRSCPVSMNIVKVMRRLGGKDE